MELKWSKSWFGFCDHSWYTPKADLLDSWNIYFVTECFLKARFGKTRSACTLWYIYQGADFLRAIVRTVCQQARQRADMGKWGPFYMGTGYREVDIGSEGDISPVMTKLHSDTILPERPFLDLSQILSQRPIFSSLPFLCADCHFFVTRGRGWTFDWPLRGLCVATFRTSPPIFCTFLHFPGPCV